MKTAPTSDERLSSSRTPIQRDADAIDCDLYRAICRAEQIYESLRKLVGSHPGPRVTDLGKSLQSLREARTGIRMLMHEDDRTRTV